MRLVKFLAHAGVASRRAAEAIIADGRVTVAGAICTDPATDVEGGEPIAVDGRTVRISESRVVWALNKPAGVVSTAADTHGRPTVVSLVKARGARLYPVGRLDADSTGLILLTDYGELANQLTHPRYGVPKVYLAEVKNGPVDPVALLRLREGVKLEDGRTLPAGVRQVKPGILEITLREGRKRQVRRMCEAVGHPVSKLRRIAFGPLLLDGLPEGGSRLLTGAEVERLYAAADAAKAPRRGGRADFRPAQTPPSATPVGRKRQSRSA